MKLLHRREVLAKTSLSQTELYRRIALGTFPAQVNLSPSRVAWLESDVDSWIDARVSESRESKAATTPATAN